MEWAQNSICLCNVVWKVLIVNYCLLYLLGDGLSPEKADEVFIQWLKSNRESGVSVTLPKVKEKVVQLFQTFGTSSIEKTCKWFLLWNNRYRKVLIKSFPFILFLWGYF